MSTVYEMLARQQVDSAMHKLEQVIDTAKRGAEAPEGEGISKANASVIIGRALVISSKLEDLKNFIA